MSEGPVVFMYDHFYPDFTAGGPVTSLVNLAEALSGKVPIRVITSSRVFGSGKSILGINTNCWSSWRNVPVWYATGTGSIGRALKSLPHHSTIYLNGIFSMSYFVFPLFRSNVLVIVSPRGMLQKGAMRRGYVKKLVFLWLLKLSGFLKKVRWHATDEEEKSDILHWFGTRSDVTVIPNVPRSAASQQVVISKSPGHLRLLYLSLISSKKNLLFLIDLLGLREFNNVSLDIAGPIKDGDYWSDCQKKIQTISNPERIQYLGEVVPENVGHVISAHHALVLPSLGENFGHVISESIGSFRPVMISDRTPWKDVEISGAGFSLSLDKQTWRDAMAKVLAWDQTAFDNAAAASMRYYQQKVNFGELQSCYIDLFKHTSK